MWICEKCGSNKVQEKTWVDLNTKEVFGTAAEDADECWCEKCQNHVKVIEEDA
jgi:hypothetical protein